MIDKKSQHKHKFDQFIGILDRGMAVLQCFSKTKPTLTIADVSELTGYSRAACRRILLTYHEIGYLNFDGKDFSLAPKILSLGFSYLSSQSVTEIARPIMEEMSKTLNEGCSLTIYEKGEIVYIVRIEAQRVMPATIGLGGRYPAYFASMGRIFLGHLPEKELDDYFKNETLTKLTPKTEISEDKLRAEIKKVKKNGYAICQDQVEIGHTSIAVPIFNIHGKLVATLNTVTHTWRTPKKKLISTYLPVLQEASRKVSASLV